MNKKIRGGSRGWLEARRGIEPLYEDLQLAASVPCLQRLGVEASVFKGLYQQYIPLGEGSRDTYVLLP